MQERFKLATAVHLFFLKDSQILLLRRFNTGYEDGKYSVVAGRRSTDERIDFFVVVHNWKGEIRNMEPDKCDELSWHSLDSLPHNVIPYVKKAIGNYSNGIMFDSFGWEGIKV